MDINESENYKMMEYAEVFDAITDKMEIDNNFYGRIINEKTDINVILEEFGFKIDGVAKQIFEESIQRIKEKTSKEIAELYSSTRR